MNYANFKNGNAKYPLSTDTMDFLQKQIQLVYGLANLYDKNYIIRQSTADTEGLIVINGELMPLKGKPQRFIRVSEDIEDIEAGGQTFDSARVSRYAQYQSIRQPRTCFSAGLFKICQPISEHIVPQGAIMMWSGQIDDIPYGWNLCDGENGTPDLRGRFIVGYTPDNTDYSTIGNTGGESSHQLTIDEMPKHNHATLTSTTNTTVTTNQNGAHSHSIPTGKSTGNSTTAVPKAEKKGWTPLNSNPAGTHTHTFTMYARGGGEAHENRPPYYVLAYIMKTI